MILVIPTDSGKDETVTICEAEHDAGRTAERTLDELASTINYEYDAANIAGGECLSHLVSCGEALQLARDRVEPGGWASWCETNLRFSAVTGGEYMRIARYRLELHGIEIASKRDALVLLRGRPLTNTGGGANAIPAAVIEEAAKYRAKGWSYRMIGDHFGVAASTLERRLNPEQMARMIKTERRRRESRRKRLQRDRAARAALLKQEREASEARQRQEQDKAVKARGGSAASAYALNRRCSLELQAAIGSTEDGEERGALEQALRHCYRVEDSIVDALRLPRIQR